MVKCNELQQQSEVKYRVKSLYVAIPDHHLSEVTECVLLWVKIGYNSFEAIA